MIREARDGSPIVPSYTERLARIGLTVGPVETDEIRFLHDVDGTTDFFHNIFGSELAKPDEIRHQDGLHFNGKLAGYVMWDHFSTKNGYYSNLRQLYISLDFRNQGFGSLLHLLARQDMLKHNPDIFCIAVSDETGKVEHLLEQLGFNRDEVDEYWQLHEQSPWSLQRNESDADWQELRRRIDTMLDARITKMTRGETPLPPKSGIRALPSRLSNKLHRRLGIVHSVH